VKKIEEDWCQKQLANEKLYELLEKHDLELVEQARQCGCQFCRGRLHRSDYDRKPYGGPAHWDKRYSLCCDQDGCRRRLTPESVRFFGRRFFVAPFFLLIWALNHGLTPERVRRLSEIFRVDARTLARWRKWWLETFVKSLFWKAARARFLPLVCEATLPLSLCQRFDVESLERLVALLKFLSPLTTSFSAGEGRAM
jgi:hypothetical protein